MFYCIIIVIGQNEQTMFGHGRAKTPTPLVDKRTMLLNIAPIGKWNWNAKWSKTWVKYIFVEWKPLRMLTLYNIQWEPTISPPYNLYSPILSICLVFMVDAALHLSWTNKNHMEYFYLSSILLWDWGYKVKQSKTK